MSPSHMRCSFVKMTPFSCFALQPLLVPLLHGVGKRGEQRLLFEREANQRDEIGEPAGLRTAAHFLRIRDGVRIPEAILGPFHTSLAQLALELLQHRLGQPLPIRTAVENLQRVDVALMLGEVVAELLHQTGGSFSCCFVESLQGGTSSGV